MSENIMKEERAKLQWNSCKKVEAVTWQCEQNRQYGIRTQLKSVFHQQDTLIGLRHQLDEVKAINVEMYQKMQVRTRTHTHTHPYLVAVIITSTYDSQ